MDPGDEPSCLLIQLTFYLSFWPFVFGTDALSYSTPLPVHARLPRGFGGPWMTCPGHEISWGGAI